MIYMLVIIIWLDLDPLESVKPFAYFRSIYPKHKLVFLLSN